MKPAIETWSLPYGWSARLSILLAVYLLVCVITLVVVVLGEGVVGPPLSAAFLWWPLPWVFPIASLVVLADVSRGLITHQPVEEKLPIFSVSAALLLVGSAFALSSHHSYAALPVVVSGAVVAVFLLG